MNMTTGILRPYTTPSYKNARPYLPDTAVLFYSVVGGGTAVLRQPQKAIGEISNIGSDKEITTREGIAIVESIMGKKARFKVRPHHPGDQLHTHANIGKARAILDYDPQIPLADILQAQVAWYTERILRYCVRSSNVSLL